jgi:hypothetical protein
VRIAAHAHLLRCFSCSSRALLRRRRFKNADNVGMTFSSGCLQRRLTAPSQSQVSSSAHQRCNARRAANVACNVQRRDTVIPCLVHIRAPTKQRVNNIAVPVLACKVQRRGTSILCLVHIRAPIDFIYWSNGVSRVTCYCYALYLVFVLSLFS